MIRCEQKYCKNCVKPVFSLDGGFVYGFCKFSRYLILQSDNYSTRKYDVQPLYCDCYKERTRKIKY